MKKNFAHIIVALLGVCLMQACQQKPAEIPAEYTELNTPANIYPDYRDIVIPPNIAPLNFMVQDTAATAFVAQLQANGTEWTLGASENGTITMDTAEWKSMLKANVGKDIRVHIYAQYADGWKRYKEHKMTVAEEEIDPYLSYRLIEPGYELYRQLGLYQRNLTNWDVKPIYENNREYDDDHNHCINCHNFQNYSTRNMLFHIRAMHGGTVIIRDGKAQKVQIKDSTIITSGVYPSWHPKQELVAFSTNKTGQSFHLMHNEKIEVLDESSDLLLYDVKGNEVSHILRSKNLLETFPCWSPDGNTLYYCCADVTPLIDPNMPDSTRSMQLMNAYNQIHYNMLAMDFDQQTRTFSEPRMVVDAEAQNKSVTFPRVSPDGRYVLYAQGRYGQFHIWHKSSDLWVKDLQADTCYALKQANSWDIESYHSWSSNGRWIAFSTRRMDQNYTRVFLTYFDKNGVAHKAFAIPQEDPEYNVLLLKSYNVPELTKNAVNIDQAGLHHCVYETEGENALYKR